MTPAYTKLFRTLLFMIALGAITAYTISQEGNWINLLIYVSGILMVYGVDEMSFSYGKLKVKLGSQESQDSQTDKDTDPQE